ncbi:hypothetical protein SAURM35S_07265 [Streptomyces aurantiogriseus]
MAAPDVHADTRRARRGVRGVDVRHGDRLAQRGGGGAGGDLADHLAAGDDRVPGARDTAALGDQADEDARRVALGPLGGLGEGRAPHEVALLLELHHPAEPGVEGGQPGRQLVPVQRHARLQAQRVPAGQAAGDQADALAGLGQGLPQLHRVLRLHEQLEAVLTGVAGARDQRRDPGDGAGQPGVVLQTVEVGVGEGREDARGLGTLDGDQRVVVPVVTHLGVEAGRTLGQRVQHDLRVGGVGDDQVLGGLGLGEPVDDQVVQDAAVGAADHGVAGAADADGGDVADEREVQEGRRLRPGHGDLAHVGEVEQPGLRPHGVVLVALGAVAQGHVPAGEVGHRRAERTMQGVEGGMTEWGTAHRAFVSQGDGDPSRAGEAERGGRRGRSSPSVIGT